jgi:hypothetical protein
LLVTKQQGCFSPPLAQRQLGFPHFRAVRMNDPEIKILLCPSFLILALMRRFSISVEILSSITNSF